MPTDVIIGTNSPNYTFGPLDVGKMIYCRVRATNVAGVAFRNTAQVGPILPAIPTGIAPVNTTPPAIADIAPEVDDVLHVTDGVWDGDLPITYSYQWYRVPAPVPPTAPSPVTWPNIADTTPEVDEVLHCTEGVWDGATPITYNYQWYRVTPDPIAPSNTTAPSIADLTPEETEILHCDRGTWAGTETITYSYEWHRADAPVGGVSGQPVGLLLTITKP